jgi:hypothetical protein
VFAVQLTDVTAILWELFRTLSVYNCRRSPVFLYNRLLAGRSFVEPASVDFSNREATV